MLNKYKKNLCIQGNYIVSYDTNVAEIFHEQGVVVPLGWWSTTTAKHINYAASQLGYKLTDRMYHVTGVDRNGKRFKIVTANARHADGINLYNGTVWEVIDGKRKMIRRVYPYA